jgi:hypothetical protein
VTIRGYQLAVDWSQAGTFDAPYEDITVPGDGVLDSTSLTVSWGRADAKPAQDSTAGQLQFTLNNLTRRFSPENVNSPLYGRVLAGRRARLNVTAAGATTTLFDGPIDTLSVDPNATAKTFSATALDGWGTPGAEKLSTPVYSGLRTGDLIQIVLDQVGWDPTKRSVDYGATVVDWWCVEGSDAATAITDLVHSEGSPAIAYVLGGIFYFRDRFHRITDPLSLPGAATLNSYNFEGGLGSYALVLGGTFVASTAQAHSGTGSGLLTVVGSPTQAYVRQSPMWGVNPTRNYRATCWVYATTAQNVVAGLDWYSDKNTFLSGSYPSTAVAANTWTQLQVAATCPTGATLARFGPALISPTAGVQVYVDDVTWEQTDATQGLFTDILPAGTGPDADLKIDKGSFNYVHGLADIYNTVTFEVARRVPGDYGTVWSTDSPISLDVNASLQLIVQSEDPFIYAQIPQPFNYDIDGNPITGEYAITGGSLASITLSRTSGQTCIMTITAGGSGAFLPDGINLSATPLIMGPSVQVTSQDQSSVNTYRQQNWDGDAPPWCNAYDAQAIADRIVSLYAAPRPVINFTVTTSLSAPQATRYLASFMAQTLSGRVTIRHDEMGINADYMIERLGHVITKLGATHQLQVGVSATDPVQATTRFQFDTTGAGFDQGAFSANGLTSAATMFTFDVPGQGFDQGTFAA